MSSLRRSWADLRGKLKLLEPIEFTDGQWQLLERLQARFADREAHTQLPLPIARFRDEASAAIHRLASRRDDVETVYVDERAPAGTGTGEVADAMEGQARLFNEDVDSLMRVLVPAARYRKGHYAYGRFTFPEPHGLHTDHSAEDPGAAAEPICIARIETLGTHYVAGDYRAHDSETQSMLKALRYWVTVPEGAPEAVFDELSRRGILRTIPVNHVVLMVAGNASDDAQVTQHLAARPPEGGVHSAFFQRHYRLPVAHD